MRRVTKENLIAQIDRLYKIKDEQGQLSMNGEYTLQAYEMLLATMDSEPVGEFYEDGPLNWYQISPGDSVPDNRRTPLYRHAQPAPAVQCPFPCGWDNLNKLAIQDAAFVARGLVEGEPTTEAQRQAAISNNDRLLKVISACRAAMLAATKHDTPALNSLQSVDSVADRWIPVSDQCRMEVVQVVPEDVLEALQKVARIRLDMDSFDGDRRGIADCLCDAEEALIEVVSRRAAMLNQK